VEGWSCTVYEATGRLKTVSKLKAVPALPADASWADYLDMDWEEDLVTVGRVWCGVCAMGWGAGGGGGGGFG